MPNINKNYIAVVLVAVLFLGTIASYFALDLPDSEEIILYDPYSDEVYIYGSSQIDKNKKYIVISKI